VNIQDIMNIANPTASRVSGSPTGQSRHAGTGNNAHRARLLVVEDDIDISSLLLYTLDNAHFNTVAAPDCKTAWEMLIGNPPELVLLDWMLPDMSGIELLQRIRREPTLESVPVIMLTARSEESDRVRGLETGADDYIVKPFSPRELCARIRNRLRITRNSNADTLSIKGVVLDQVSYRTSVNGNPIELGPTEFRLLRHFMNNTERVFTRPQLLDRVWGTNVYIEERTVDVHIRRLRKALEPYEKSDLIQTVRGAGYRFSAQNP
jgi:two-component system, OmpR family, phosphate regulon response regulator PhoB